MPRNIEDFMNEKQQESFRYLLSQKFVLLFIKEDKVYLRSRLGDCREIDVDGHVDRLSLTQVTDKALSIPPNSTVKGELS